MLNNFCLSFKSLSKSLKAVSNSSTKTSKVKPSKADKSSFANARHHVSACLRRCETKNLQAFGPSPKPTESIYYFIRKMKFFTSLLSPSKVGGFSNLISRGTSVGTSVGYCRSAISATGDGERPKSIKSGTSGVFETFVLCFKIGCVGFVKTVSYSGGLLNCTRFGTTSTTCGTRMPRADKGGFGMFILSSHHTAPGAGT